MRGGLVEHIRRFVHERVAHEVTAGALDSGFHGRIGQEEHALLFNARRFVFKVRQYRCFIGQGYENALKARHERSVWLESAMERPRFGNPDELEPFPRKIFIEELPRVASERSGSFQKVRKVRHDEYQVAGPLYFLK